ncbi:AlpA family transcriptional regulator [Oryzihumus leptocrescens]|uniref:AlpA family transcriptional regulator n=1 Tax=Oryzihumus leptocrescens TaxID=297536 RepID=A0A542ZF37_9MICO|nr:AlpA family transcriptional regulator [Oryzihumus leptocrescens]
MEGQRESVERPVLLNVEQAAAWCGITRNTLNHLRTHGRFAPAIKMGRRCFWKPEHLNAWIESQLEVAA